MDYALFVNVAAHPSRNSPKAFAISQNVLSLGRSAEIKIDTNKGKEISRHHASILRQTINDQIVYIIEDNDSINGTFVNGCKVKRRVLSDGDEVVFGGGQCFEYGETLYSTENSECRYMFCRPQPQFEFLDDENNTKAVQGDGHNECCICYQKIYRSCAAPCGHDICSSCMRRWIDHCLNEGRQPVCPVCRKEFTSIVCSQPDIAYKNGVIEVSNVDGILQKLGMTSLKEIYGLSLFNLWDSEKKQKFWECIQSLRKNHSRTALFKHYVGATYRQICEASNSQLLNAVKNMGGEENLTGSKLLEEALSLVATKINGVKSTIRFYRPARVSAKLF